MKQPIGYTGKPSANRPSLVSMGTPRIFSIKVRSRRHSSSEAGMLQSPLAIFNSATHSLPETETHAALASPPSASSAGDQ